MVKFLRPEIFYLFIAFFLLLIYVYWKLNNAFKVRKAWENSRLRDISRFSSKKRKFLVYCLFFFMLAFMVFALSRPQVSYKKPAKKPLDIVCLVDLSRSMNTPDVLLSGKKVFRIELVKTEMRNFVKNYIGKEKNQMALIVFADKALYRSFFTFDVSSLLFHIDYFDVKDFPPEGTDIGWAIIYSLNMLDIIDSKPDVFKRPENKRVFVLISDGEDLGEYLSEAIIETRKRRISVYTIGAGSREGGYIVEEMDENGNFSYMIDEDTGEKIFSRLEEETLKIIARETGGQYVYSKSGEELNRAFIDVIEKEAKKETKTEKAYHDIYRYLLGCALVLCLIIIILHI